MSTIEKKVCLEVTYIISILERYIDVSLNYSLRFAWNLPLVITIDAAI